MNSTLTSGSGEADAETGAGKLRRGSTLRVGSDEHAGASSSPSKHDTSGNSSYNTNPRSRRSSTTTIRSSRSTLNSLLRNRNPPWKTTGLVGMGKSKSAASVEASLNVVFAEAEQAGADLEDDERVGGKTRTRMSAVETVMGAAASVGVVASEDRNLKISMEESEADKDNGRGKDKPKMWFSSLARSKGKQVQQKVISDSQHESELSNPPPPTLQIIAPTPDMESTPTFFSSFKGSSAESLVSSPSPAFPSSPATTAADSFANSAVPPSSSSETSPLASYPPSSDNSTSTSLANTIPIISPTPTIPIVKSSPLSFFGLGANSSPAASASPQNNDTASLEGKRSWFSSPPTPPPPPMPQTPPPVYPSMEGRAGLDTENDKEKENSSLPAPSESQSAATSPSRIHSRELSVVQDQNQARSTSATVSHPSTSLVFTVPPASPTSTLAGTSTKASESQGSGSGSGFVLSWPLLGRTKIPLGSVIGLSGPVTLSESGSGADDGGDGKRQEGESEGLTTTKTARREEQEKEQKQERAAEDRDVGPVSPVEALDSVGLRGVVKEDERDQLHQSPFVVQANAVGTTIPTTSSADGRDGQEDRRGLGRQDVPGMGAVGQSLTSASWWDYVGWLGTSTNAGLDASSLVPTPARGEEPIPTDPTLVHDLVEDAERVDELRNGGLEAVEQAQDGEGEKTEGGGEANESMGQSEQSQEGVTSAWLAPWHWYYSNSTTTTATKQEQKPSERGLNEELEKDTEGDVGSGRAQREEIEAEVAIVQEVQIHSGHQGGRRYLQRQRHEENPGENQLIDSTNPVLSTILSAHNRSGWASFFSSSTNRMLVKSLGYGYGEERTIEGTEEEGREGDDVKRDEDGMEIMDVDFEDAAEGVGEEEARGRGVEKERTKDKATVEVPPKVQPRSMSVPSNANRNDKEPISTTDVISIKRDSHSSNNAHASTSTVVMEGVAKLIAGSAATTRRSGSRSRTQSGRSTPVLANTPKSPTPSMGNGNGNGKEVEITTTTTTTKISVKDKDKDTKRTASPAPSKKSISGSGNGNPPLLPPPNLVLPTWDDTFFTYPRAFVEPPPRPIRGKSEDEGGGAGGKLFGKTMKFVSSVLLGGGAGAASDARRDGGISSGVDVNPNANRKGKGRDLSGTGTGSAPEVGGGVLWKEERLRDFGKELPKAWKVLEDAGWDVSPTQSPSQFDSTGGATMRPKSRSRPRSSTISPSSASVHGPVEDEFKVKGAVNDVLRGCKRVVVIGVHGWFPGAMIRTVLGEPTGTSTKFANMMAEALRVFEEEHGVKLEKVTKVPLEGEGTIERRVERLYANLLANEEWMTDLHEADAIIVATHSQGSVVSTHLLDRLIRENHIITSKNQVSSSSSTPLPLPVSIGMGMEDISVPIVPATQHHTHPYRKVQRVCCLALCGIHLGPLRYLNSSTLVGPYLQYFESTAARELFEFQNMESKVSREYVKALENVLGHGTKVVYVASLNDQVVPIYSGLFTVVSHPLILRALYIDGDAYHSSDFLSKLLVLLLRILNAGISDSGLLTHLSEATAGSLNGVGHSTAYEDLATYSLAVKYLFLANDGYTHDAQLMLEPFNAAQEQNDYEIPWALRDVIADEHVAHFFGREIGLLRDAFKEWFPKTSILRDLKRKLSPIQRLQTNESGTFRSAVRIGSSGAASGNVSEGGTVLTTSKL